MYHSSEIMIPKIKYIIGVIFIFAISCSGKKTASTMISKDIPRIIVQLPQPEYKSQTSVEEALLKRRSVRNYSKEPLELKKISQLLWAAQGITDKKEGGRTAPSAGALYPLEVYVITGNVESLIAGVYLYQPDDHTLKLITEGDKRKLLTASALMQDAVQRSPAVLVFTAIYSRTTGKYLDRGRRYVHMEAGHAAQNVYLQAVSLKLGVVVIGAFSDSLVKSILHLPKEEEPLYLMPVGKI